ncbi:MAG: hypothetical protein K6F83_08895 [Clostridiales bacterium]|nr:hypothetical protein [Clostridiales bacterium]
MKKIKLTSVILSLIFVMSGCGALKKDQPKDTSSATSDTAPATEAVTSASDTEDTASQVIETVDDDDDEDYFQYRMLVTSPMFEQVMGEDMTQAYKNFIAAIENGEDHFECSDENTFYWMMGQYAYNCNPVVADFTQAVEFKDGTGYFQYTIPEEEFREKEKEFEELVTDILNEALEPEYSDIECALALYSYIAMNYEYDYDKYNEPVITGVTPYRFLTGGKGICQEIGIAYAFLLMQLDIDAAGVGGNNNETGHEWTIIRINGKCYNIDATWALGSSDLSYFMMTDAQREFEGGFIPEKSRKVNNYPYEMDPDYVSPYVCNDESFEEIWGTYFDHLDAESDLLYYRAWDDITGWYTGTFDLSGFD